MESANLLLRGASLSLMLLLVIQLCLHHIRLPSGRWLLALLISLIAYVIHPVIWSFSPASLKFLWVALGTAVPALFWFFCLSLFNEKSNPEPLYWLLSIVYIVLGLTGYLLRDYRFEAGDSTAGIMLTFYLPQSLKVVVLALALLAILQNWRADLVESRRRLRVAMAMIIGIHMTIVVLVELYVGVDADSPHLELLNALGIAVITLLAVNWLFGSGLAGLTTVFAIETASATTQPPGPVSAAETAWLQQLSFVVERDGGYRENGLTIGKLAQHLSIPEYQLRRLINRHLGFRNFNDYLNYYRIEEASRRLRDPEQRQVPILTIALDVGYNSLAPFNRAFKNKWGLTPSEYRRHGSGARTPG